MAELYVIERGVPAPDAPAHGPSRKWRFDRLQPGDSAIVSRDDINSVRVTPCREARRLNCKFATERWGENAFRVWRIEEKMIDPLQEALDALAPLVDVADAYDFLERDADRVFIWASVGNKGNPKKLSVADVRKAREVYQRLRPPLPTFDDVLQVIRTAEPYRVARGGLRMVSWATMTKELFSDRHHHSSVAYMFMDELSRDERIVAQRLSGQTYFGSKEIKHEQ